MRPDCEDCELKSGDGAAMPRRALWRLRHGIHDQGQSIAVDARIRHVTKPNANLFLELGFSPAEAKELHAVSRKQIEGTK